MKRAITPAFANFSAVQVRDLGIQNRSFVKLNLWQQRCAPELPHTLQTRIQQSRHFSFMVAEEAFERTFAIALNLPSSGANISVIIAPTSAGVVASVPPGNGGSG